MGGQSARGWNAQKAQRAPKRPLLLLNQIGFGLELHFHAYTSVLVI